MYYNWKDISFASFPVHRVIKPLLCPQIYFPQSKCSQGCFYSTFYSPKEGTDPDPMLFLLSFVLEKNYKKFMLLCHLHCIFQLKPCLFNYSQYNSVSRQGPHASNKSDLPLVIIINEESFIYPVIDGSLMRKGYVDLQWQLLI